MQSVGVVELRTSGPDEGILRVELFRSQYVEGAAGLAAEFQFSPDAEDGHVTIGIIGSGEIEELLGLLMRPARADR